jgi:hypothetical protein
MSLMHGVTVKNSVGCFFLQLDKFRSDRDIGVILTDVTKETAAFISRDDECLH